MRNLLITLFASAGLLFTPGIVLGDDEQDDIRQELREARRELNEAARKVAELSRQLGGDREIIISAPRIVMQKAMLGVTMSTDALSDDSAKGVTIDAVSPGGPADEAGLRAGDVLLSIDSHSLAGDGSNPPAQKLRDYMEKVNIGDEVEIAYERDSKPGTVTVTVDAFNPGDFAWSFDFDGMRDFVMPRPPSADRAPRAPRPPSAMFFQFSNRWGALELVSLTGELGRYFGTDRGLLVVRAPDDEALKIREGDVIVKIGGREPSSPHHAMRILRSYEGGESVELEIFRDKRRRTLSVEIPDRETVGRWDLRRSKRDDSG